jgi:hypothetical protein
MRIKNWGKFQHYKHRNPPWIRLYKCLLDDPEWMMLSDAASRMLAMCWLIASENDGELPSVTKIAWRVRKDVATVLQLISELDHWIEQDASTMLAPCKQDATTETETDNSETETETEARASAPARNRSRGCSLPPNWEPSPEDKLWAFRKEFPDAWVQEQTDQMRLWAEANSNRAIARKADWSKTWRGWLSREWAKHRPSAALQVSPLMAAADRAIARADALADPFAELEKIPPGDMPALPEFLRRN